MSKSTQQRLENGFTLIELMIVVAIMGILATMAVPSYQERAIKAQIQEGLGLAEYAKESINAFYRAQRRMPKNNAEAGLPPADKIIGNHVAAIEVADGAVHIKFGNRANKNAVGKVVTVRPAAVSGYSQVPLAWNCGTAEPPAGMKAFGANQTTMPGVFLPVNCRGEK